MQKGGASGVDCLQENLLNMHITYIPSLTSELWQGEGLVTKGYKIVSRTSISPKEKKPENKFSMFTS